MVPVLRILAPNPGLYTLEGTNTWIVGRERTAVIDPGPEEPGHLEEVARSAGKVEVILVTHGHDDHAPGAGALSRRTGAPVMAFGPGPDRQRLRDEQAVEVDGATIRAYHTPGHAPDHAVFFVEEDGLLFTGDSVLGRGTSVIDPPEGDLAAYLRSLKRMQGLRPRTIYPGHGPSVFDAHGKLEEYVVHRQDREREVLAALRAEGGEPRSPEELVPEIYADYPDEVRPLAARSVLAHLLKLEGEGRVERTGKADEPRFAWSEPRVCTRCGRPVKGRARLCGPCSLALLQEGSS